MKSCNSTQILPNTSNDLLYLDVSRMLHGSWLLYKRDNKTRDNKPRDDKTRDNKPRDNKPRDDKTRDDEA